MDATEIKTTTEKILAWGNDSELKEMHDFFVRAAKTDRRLPAAFPSQRIGTSWLDIPSDWHSFGWDKTAKITIKPNPKDITEYDKALELGLKLDKETRQLIWAVAVSFNNRPYGTWTRLAREYKCTRQTVRNRYRGALQRAYLINKFSHNTDSI